MKKWAYILILFPVTAMAGESGFGSFLGKIFPRTTENVNGVVDTWTAPADGSHLGNAITNQFAPGYPQQQYPQGYPQQGLPQQGYPTAAQPPLPAQTQAVTPARDNSKNETLVRCMYMGKLIEEHTKLSEESVESQEIVERTKKLYSNLKCNDELQGYTQVMKQVDQAVNPSTGQLQN